MLCERVSTLLSMSILYHLEHASGPLLKQIADHSFPNSVAPMENQQSRRRIPQIQFRVLIIGRANAGKTTILQRVCETTESPIIYRGNKQVRSPTFFVCDFDLTVDQVKLDPTMEVSVV